MENTLKILLFIMIIIAIVYLSIAIIVLLLDCLSSFNKKEKR